MKLRVQQHNRWDVREVIFTKDNGKYLSFPLPCGRHDMICEANLTKYVDKLVTFLTEETMEVKQVDEMVEKLRVLTQERKALDKELSANKLEVGLLHAQLKSVLEDEGRDSYKCASGTFSYKFIPTFRVPSDEENREIFFNHLKEEGLYDSMITVHSAKINSYGVQLKEDKGEDYKIPGIDQGDDRIKYSFRK